MVRREINGDYVYFVAACRDRMSADDIVGTHYIPLSLMCSNGELGDYYIHVSLFSFLFCVCSSFCSFSPKSDLMISKVVSHVEISKLYIQIVIIHDKQSLSWWFYLLRSYGSDGRSQWHSYDVTAVLLCVTLIGLLFFLWPRDRISKDDTIGTAILATSLIASSGGSGIYIR